MVAAIDGMQDIIKEFLVESAEGVDVLDRDLIALEREPDSRELLAEIFRAVHTLKGNSGALGYPKLESVAHAGENALSRLRDGELTLSSETTNGLLAMVDALRGLLRAIEEEGGEGDGDYSSVISSLSGLAERAGSAKADEKASLPSAEADSFSKTTALDAGPKARTTRATLSSATCKVQPENLRGAAEAAPPQVATSARSIRVPVGVLDRMMNLVGELVLARNQVLHSAFGVFRRQPGYCSAAIEIGHRRPARVRDEGANAAHRQRLEPASPAGSRHGCAVRQADRDRDERLRDRARQDHPRGDQGPTDSHPAQRHRSWHRVTRRAYPGRENRLPVMCA